MWLLYQIAFYYESRSGMMKYVCVCVWGGGGGGEELDLCVNIVMSKSLSTCTVWKLMWAL